MKVVRFETAGEISFGILDEADGGGIEIVELAADPLVAGFDTTGRRLRLEDVRLLAPVIPRSKVVCVGKNYADHVEEMRSETGGETPEEPLLFLKPNTSVIGPGDRIVRPEISDRVEHEGELAMVIGAVAKNVPKTRRSSTCSASPAPTT